MVQKWLKRILLIPQIVYIFILKTPVSLVQLSTLLHKVKTWDLHPRSLLPKHNIIEKAFIALCKAWIMAEPFHLTQKTKVIESQIFDFRHILFCVLISVKNRANTSSEI